MNVFDIYLFYIKKGKEKEYYLTSSVNSVNYDGNIYLPYSGLSLVSGNFNDSAENHIVLHGIFENSGISKKDDFIGADIKIMRIRDNEVKHFVTYVCTQHNINDLDFEIYCESESIKYNRSLLEMFSKTCRANFGDQRCKINLEEYSVKCSVLSCSGKMLVCDIEGQEDGYFTGGKLVDSNQNEFNILIHIHNNIEIENSLMTDFSVGDQVTLVPTCDKKFRTCCYSFNNAVNFRGEPAIPESNIVKN